MQVHHALGRRPLEHAHVRLSLKYKHDDGLQDKLQLHRDIPRQEELLLVYQLPAPALTQSGVVSVPSTEAIILRICGKIVPLRRKRTR